jgi:hypothetical protein
LAFLLLGKVDDADPQFDVQKVPVEELSEEMKKLTPTQREKHVRDLLARREELQKQIADLAKKREAYLEAERQKNPNAADKAFDAAVRGALRDQAKKKGIDIPQEAVSGARPSFPGSDWEQGAAATHPLDSHAAAAQAPESRTLGRVAVLGVAAATARAQPPERLLGRRWLHGSLPCTTRRIRGVA